MGLLKLALTGLTGYAAYMFYRRNQNAEPGATAFATGEATPGFAPVRNAGPDAMASEPQRWDKVDQEIDESFPVSDPPPLGKR